MKSELKKEIEIDYTSIDSNLKLSVEQAVIIVQNVTTQFFATIGSDNLTVKRNDNALWVLTKMKIHFFKYPIWGDKVYITTHISSQSRIRLEVETNLKDEDGNLVLVAKQEIVSIDAKTRKIRKIDTITYPQDIEIIKTIYEEAYQKLNFELKDLNKIYERKVHSIDMDFSKHTNNVKYVNFIENTLTSEFFDNNEITDIEIHYLHETREGDILDIYNLQEEEEIKFYIMSGEKEVIKASFRYRAL